jgi:excinuclease UvrABC ATPase subunit
VTQYSNNEQKKIQPIEYFYLESPSLPEEYFPITLYGIYDRITVEKDKIERLKEDIIKILAEANKFGIREEENKKDQDNIERYTDKNYDPEYNISYPEFTSKHFSPNRIE